MGSTPVEGKLIEKESGTLIGLITQVFVGSNPTFDMAPNVFLGNAHFFNFFFESFYVNGNPKKYFGSIYVN